MEETCGAQCDDRCPNVAVRYDLYPEHVRDGASGQHVGIRTNILVVNAHLRSVRYSLEIRTW